MLSSANLLPFLIVAASCRFIMLENLVKPCRPGRHMVQFSGRVLQCVGTRPGLTRRANNARQIK